MTDDFDALFDEPLDRRIRQRARSLAARLRTPARDEADYRQDLALVVLAGRPAHDPGRAAWGTFAYLLTERATSGIDRSSRAAKRGRGRTRSLESLRTPDGPVEIPARDEVANFELALDVAAVLASLSPDLLDLALRLPHDPIATVARDLGLSRTTVYRRLAELRQAFERGGFGESAVRGGVDGVPAPAPRSRRR